MLTNNAQGDKAFEFSLTVLLTQEDGGWFAQSLEIDYAACGETIEETKENFISGLTSTMKEHMLMHNSLKHFLKPADADAWDLYYKINNSSASVKALDALPKDSGCEDSAFLSLKNMFPFGKIAFLDPCQHRFMWVQRAIVINVLEKCSSTSGFSVSTDENDVLLVKNGIPESIRLPEKVPSQMLQRLSKKYGVNIEYFFHQEMIH